jgi:predicted secreted protein
MRELGTPDDGAELTVTPGTDFLVRLPENATTGYQWQVAERPEWLICRSDRSVPAAPGSRAGAGGTHEFVFEAPGSGPAPAPGWLVLHLRREWEPEGQEVATFRVRLSG